MRIGKRAVGRNSDSYYSELVEAADAAGLNSLACRIASLAAQCLHCYDEADYGRPKSIVDYYYYFVHYLLQTLIINWNLQASSGVILVSLEVRRASEESDSIIGCKGMGNLQNWSRSLSSIDSDCHSNFR